MRTIVGLSKASQELLDAMSSDSNDRIEGLSFEPNSAPGVSTGIPLTPGAEFEGPWCRRSQWVVVWDQVHKRPMRKLVAPCNKRYCPACGPKLAAADAEEMREVLGELFRRVGADGRAITLYRMVLGPTERGLEVNAIRKAEGICRVIPQDGRMAVVYSTYRSRRVSAQATDSWDSVGYSDSGVDLRRQVVEDCAGWSGCAGNENLRHGGWNAKGEALRAEVRANPDGQKPPRKEPETVESVPGQRLVLTNRQIQAVDRFVVLRDAGGKPHAWRLPDPNLDTWQECMLFVRTFGDVCGGALGPVLAQYQPEQWEPMPLVLDL